jgi:hypothetical protein
VVDAVSQRMRDRVWGDGELQRWLAGELDALQAGTTTPYLVADAVLARSAARFSGEER